MKFQLLSESYDPYMDSLDNLWRMMFHQMSGLPSASHGYFLKHHIEALTLHGVKTSDKQLKNFKHNSIKLTRFILTYFYKKSFICLNRNCLELWKER